MIYYEIKLKSIPRFLFAYSVKVQDYKNTFSNKENFLELCIIEEGSIRCEEENGNTTTLKPKSFTSMLSDINCKTYAINNEPQTHTTVGVSVEYEYVRKDSKDLVDLNSLEKKVKNENIILIPFQDDLSGEEYYSTLSQLKQVIAFAHSPHPYDNIQALSAWFKLCSTITKRVFNKLEQNQYNLSPSILLYISKAKNYIFEHYQENVTVIDVANHLKLSEGYLQSIFHSATGMSIISFLNHYRIEIAKELIIHKGLTLQETAKQIGIADPSYMSRLFRKITGTTYSQFFSQYSNRIFYKKI